jgi:hypothetical protein
LELFEPSELELLICGNPELNLHDLEKGTKYEDGYDGNSPAVRNLWTVLGEFDEQEKKLFLKFISGR